MHCCSLYVVTYSVICLWFVYLMFSLTEVYPILHILGVMFLIKINISNLINVIFYSKTQTAVIEL